MTAATTVWIALLTLGEGWHNNHHRCPGAARQGFRWWEIDLTYYVLRLFASVGLIWDLRPVPAHLREREHEDAHRRSSARASPATRSPGSCIAQHEITVFEAADWIGGHTHTVDVRLAAAHLRDRYRLHRLQRPDLPELPAAAGRDRRRDAAEHDELLRALRAHRPRVQRHVAQRRCSRSAATSSGPRSIGMLRDILRFNREAPALLDAPAHRGHDARRLPGSAIATVASSFEHYLMPMGAAIWSTEPARMLDCPGALLHSLLQQSRHAHASTTGPQWRVVRGGSRTYVEKLTAPFRDRIRTQRAGHAACGACRAASRSRRSDGTRQRFDAVFIACHSDQALRLLHDPTPREREVLGAIPYQANDVVLHTDTRLLPARRRAWAAWNYHVLDATARRRRGHLQHEHAAVARRASHVLRDAQSLGGDRSGEGDRRASPITIRSTPQPPSPRRRVSRS